MNKTIRFLLSLSTLFVFLCCGGSSNQGVKYNPTHRQSSLSDAEREEKLAQMRQELGGISIDTMLFSHGVKMSVLPPAIGGDITERVAEKIMLKMLAITTQNGIGGVGTNPCIALAASMESTNRAATGTAPQKMLVEYDVTFYVINCVTSDVYGSQTIKVSGVGNTFAHATQTSVNSIENSSELQALLSTSSERIVNWYNSNIPLLKSKIAQAITDNDYAYALALLESVPEQAEECYNWANSEVSNVLHSVMRQRATENFSMMKGAIAAAGFSYDPSIAAYMKMIPSDSPEYKEAQQLYDNYTKSLNDERLAEIDHERQMQMEQFAWEKEKAKLKMDASMKKMELDASVEKSKAFGNFMSGTAVGGLLTNLLMRPIMAPFRFFRIF